ncbi:MAG: DUF5667 domain-containing protein [Patescibacteria group bacterium]
MGFILWIIAGVLVLGGGTAVVADSAVPGDPLYNLDQAMEQWQEKWISGSDQSRAKFNTRLIEERMQEWEALQDINPEELTSKALELWQQHNEDAAERISARVERLHVLQADLTNKLAEETNTQKQAVLQKLLNNLGTAEEKRMEKLNEVKERAFPGIDAILKQAAHFQVWKELPQTEQLRIREQVRNTYREMKNNFKGKSDNTTTNSTPTNTDTTS